MQVVYNPVNDGTNPGVIKTVKHLEVQVNTVPYWRTTLSTVDADGTEGFSTVPGWGRSSGVANGNPLQYRLENSMDRGVWWVLQSMGTQKIGSTECTLTGCRA